jgi:hypothetical protein
MITLYFLLPISWTLISMVWFIIENHFRTKNEMTKQLYAFSGLLQKIFCCCCFPSSKSDEKTDEDEQLNKPVNQNSNQVIITQRPIALESIYRRQDYPINGIQSIETNEKTTSKCDFCNRCKLCQADFDKDKDKDKKKKDIEAKCSALNYLILLCVSLLMLVSNIVVWILMSR